MNKKNLLKFVLDIGMTIVFVLMYSKIAISLTFHEIGGLALLSTFLFHILINWKWVVVVTKKLSSKDIPVKTKLSYLINILLLLSFVLIGISGIMISKIVFHISSFGSLPWKAIHYSCSALALILVGIHLGLHKQFITNMLTKVISLPKKISNTVGIVLSLVIFCYGCYSISTTSFTSWLVMPFTQQAYSFDSKEGGRMQKGDFAFSQLPEQSETTAPNQNNSDAISNSDSSVNSAITDSSSDSNFSNDDMPSVESSRFNGNRHGGSDRGRDFDATQGSGILRVISTIASFFSITFVFAAAAYIIELITKLIKKNKKKSI